MIKILKFIDDLIQGEKGVYMYWLSIIVFVSTLTGLATGLALFIVYLQRGYV
jgi:hypothetical protein